MSIRLLLLALTAAAVPAVLATPAGAEPCALVHGVPPYDAAVIVCTTEGDCLVYQHSGSQIHKQVPICVVLR